jgi:putative transcriptional regulator
MEMMDAELFEELVASMKEMNEIVQGKRKPSRVFIVNPIEVRAIREATGLSQVKFAKVIRVPVGTLKNWEQGHREPTGPARALLHVIRKDPKHTIKALEDAV